MNEHGQAQILALLFTACLTLRKVFNLFVPQLLVFPNCAWEITEMRIFTYYVSICDSFSYSELVATMIIFITVKETWM